VKKANSILAVALIVFGIGYAYLTLQLPKRNLPNTLSSSFMPWVLVISLELLAILLLLKNSIKGTDELGDVHVTGKESVGIITITVIVFAYVKVMKYFGFLISTPLFIAGLMVLSGSRKWKEIILVSIIASFGIYFFFYKLFRVVLPPGNLF